MKKLFGKSILLLICLILCFTACSGDDVISDTSESTEALDTSPYTLNIDGYTVVYPDTAMPELKKHLEVFCNLLRKYTGADIKLSTDAESCGEKEILLDYTDREETERAYSKLKKAALDFGKFIITNEGEKIVILGETEGATVRAMKHFLMNYAKGCTEENAVDFYKGNTEIDVVNVNSIIFDNFTEFSIEHTSEVTSLQSSQSSNAIVFSYESVIELAHNGEHNGTLIATYSTYRGPAGARIHRSTDGGKTWKYISTAYNNISTTKVRQNMQASLFELPRDMGKFKEGTLFLADSSYSTNAQGEETTAIALYYSTDLGSMWYSYCTLKTGLNYNVHLGVYEPFLYYDEATRRVYCFYADETEPKASPGVQKLVCHYTEDMENWSETVDVINGDHTTWRPGMPNVTKMGNGEYFLVYEIYEETMGAPIYYQKIKSLNEFDTKNYGTILESTDGKRLSASPWCAWTPEGGECGTLIVVACGMHKSKALWGQSDMFVSFDYGETFTAIRNPIFVSSNNIWKIGYSPWVGFSEDGRTLHYMNNTADYDCKVSVMYSRIKIW